MLKIYLGEMEGAIYHPPTYFDNRYEDEWITKPLSIEMIKDIDKSVVVGPHLIQSPVLGPISTKELSGGVKTLILMAFDFTGKVFNASVCGDNCAKWILKISREKELTINLRHIMEFPEEEFQAEILNNGVIVQGMNSFVDIAAEYV
ncbi:MAG: DUF4869 domain-containing protein [Blautia sp.]|uniref:DUF4869 domain-containing protein n=1 Tax=Blautia sp. TaxID=1955243 RepID=UPI002E7856D1|nr:DUF4869 domain-containing protein [Blautia sp.]MEE1444267.1 DUF4869 domain-containing protein [Blautia sp.]